MKTFFFFYRLKKGIFKVHLAASNERNAEIHFPLHSSRQIGHDFFSEMSNINPFIFIRNNRSILFSGGFSALEKDPIYVRRGLSCPSSRVQQAADD
jgi:hypothetical protein